MREKSDMNEHRIFYGLQLPRAPLRLLNRLVTIMVEKNLGGYGDKHFLSRMQSYSQLWALSL